MDAMLSVVEFGPGDVKVVKHYGASGSQYLLFGWVGDTTGGQAVSCGH